MDVFVCTKCGAELTAPVARVPLPPEAHGSYGHGAMPPLMEPGTYAVDPLPSGPPYRLWADIEEADAAAQGVFAPVFSLSFGPAGRIVIAPGDTRGTVLIPEHSGDSCLGMCAGEKPNMACAACGSLVASREDDCGMWQAVWMEPDAVRRVPTGRPAPAPVFTPVLPEDPRGGWSDRWSAAAGAALAHLLVASGGDRVELPGGYAELMFARAVEASLPADGAVRRVGVAGPGVPADGNLDIALVPAGAPDAAGGALPVPLPDGVWACLALPGETSPLPAAGVLPGGVLRDDYPVPDRPGWLFAIDYGVFFRTLSRLPEVRQPWLRALYDELRSTRSWR
ncbi:hypothetical protein AB0C52_01505 [Streptomyces sp. NPDC048717]|uniref:hypothetical protein n=1 Tax=Streptomyces sp. NPDC048717 TaxID=3154928 RepID=UPI00344617B2